MSVPSLRRLRLPGPAARLWARLQAARRGLAARAPTRLERGLGLAAGFVILPVTYLVFATNGGAPLWRGYVGAGLLASAAWGVLPAALLLAGRRGWAAAVLGVYFLLFADIMFDLNAPGRAAVVAATAAGGWLVWTHLPAILGAAFAAMLAATAVPAALASAGGDTGAAGAPAARAAPSGPPTIVHILLDGHIGAEGVPPEFAEETARIRAFWREQGFRLFGRAYSHYGATGAAVPNMVNLTASETNGAFIEWQGNRRVLTRNRYFERLHAAGYRVHLRVFEYIDYCSRSDAIADCGLVDSVQLGVLDGLPLAAGQKGAIVMDMMVGRSKLLKEVRRAYNRFVRPGLAAAGLALPAWNIDDPLPLAAIDLALLARAADEVARHPAGHLYYFHLRTPHAPFVVDSACRLKPPATWGTSHGHDDELRNTPATRLERYAAYFEQLRCTEKAVARFFDRLRASGAWERMIVVLHGDHGSRIALTGAHAEFLDEMTDRDFTDYYSTLFAVRGPGIVPGYDRRAAPLERLLSAAVLETALGAPGLAGLRGDEPQILYLTKERKGPLVKVSRDLF